MASARGSLQGVGAIASRHKAGSVSQLSFDLMRSCSVLKRQACLWPRSTPSFGSSNRG
jgi:hypothetical protein